MAIKRPIDMWEDKERCCYCKHHIQIGKKYYCQNEESDYYTDWTDTSFGCEHFEMSDYSKKELEASNKRKEKEKSDEK